MKILDRYIVWTFLVSLAIVLVAMVGLALVLDLFINVAEFMEEKGPAAGRGFGDVLGAILDYYFYKIFEYFQLIVGPGLLVAAASSLARFNRTKELTAMKAAGISLYRVLWPMIAVALTVAAFYVVNQEALLPRFAEKLVRDPDDVAARDAFAVEFIRDEHNNILYAPVYDPTTGEMRSEARPVAGGGGPPVPVYVRIFLRDAEYRPVGTIEAERAAWHAQTGEWELAGGRRYLARPAGATGEVEEDEGVPVRWYATNVTPAVIERHRSRDYYRYVSYGALEKLLRDPLRGNRRKIHVAMHEHVTAPIMLVLVFLLGSPFVAGREEKSYFVSIGVAISLWVGVFVLTFVSRAYGNAGHIDPLLAAWLPVFVVLPASVLALESVRT